ncbi:MAG: hypothetical protein WC584_02080 [Candidatus Pacearchaeota archaeon]
MIICPKSKRSAHASNLLFNSKIVNSKRSLSTVVATLLMILLVVVAVAIVSQIIIPMVKKDLSSAGNCLDAIGNVQFNTKYTCYTTPPLKVKLSIEVKKVNVDGFVINVFGAGNAESYTIKEGNTDTSISMPGSPNIILPKENEAKTYEIILDMSDIPETITLAPIVGSETCEKSDQMILDKCSTV